MKLILLILIATFTHAITLDDFLATAYTHPTITQQRLAIDASTADILRTKGANDITLTASPYYSDEEPIQTNPFSPAESTIYGINAGLSKSIWSTGGTLSLTAETNKFEQTFNNNAFTAGSNLSDILIYQNMISLTYSQPLLKNIAGILSRLDYDIAKLDKTITTLTVDEQHEQFLLGMGRHYLDWVLLQEQEKIYTTRYEIAYYDLDLTKKKRRSNLVTSVDVLRSEDAFRQAKEQLVLIRSQLKAKQTQLSTVLDSPTIQTTSPNFKLFVTAPLPPKDRPIHTSRLLTQLKVEQAKAKRRIQAGKNNTRSNLSLDTTLGLADGNESPNDARSFDKSTYQVALNYSRPIGQRTTKAELTQFKLAATQLTMQQDALTRDLNATAKSLLIQLHELTRILRLNQEQIALARKRTKDEYRYYTQGRNQFNAVLESRANEQQRQLAYASNAHRFHTLWLQYLALTDQLLERVQ